MSPIQNTTRGTLIAQHPVFAKTFSQRARGMIGRDFSGFDAMLFLKCPAVHTFFMSIPLDLIFFDRQKKIIKCVRALKPWVAACCAPGAWGVIEMPAGAIDESASREGDQIVFTIPRQE